MARKLLDEAAVEEKERDKTYLEQVAQIAKESVERDKAWLDLWVEQYRQGWRPFADGSLIQGGGKIRVVDDIPTPYDTAPSYTHQVGYHANGIPLCHSSGQPERCVRSKGDDCWQCCYNPRNTVRNEGWFE